MQYWEMSKPFYMHIIVLYIAYIMVLHISYYYKLSEKGFGSGLLIAV